jgi:hypothetical protein
MLLNFDLYTLKDVKINTHNLKEMYSTVCVTLKKADEIFSWTYKEI